MGFVSHLFYPRGFVVRIGLENVKRTAPRFVQRTERAWFNEGKALRQQLGRGS